MTNNQNNKKIFQRPKKLSTNQSRIESLIKNYKKYIEGITCSNLWLRNCPKEIVIDSSIFEQEFNMNDKLFKFTLRDLKLFILKKFNLFLSNNNKNKKKENGSKKYHFTIKGSYFVEKSLLDEIDSEEFGDKYELLSKYFQESYERDPTNYQGMLPDMLDRAYSPPSIITIQKIAFKENCKMQENIDENSPQFGEKVQKIQRALSIFFLSKFNLVNSTQMNRDFLIYGRRIIKKAKNYRKRRRKKSPQKKSTQTKKKTNQTKKDLGSKILKISPSNAKKKKVYKIVVKKRKTKKVEEKNKTFVKINYESKRNEETNFPIQLSEKTFPLSQRASQTITLNSNLELDIIHALLSLKRAPSEIIIISDSDPEIQESSSMGSENEEISPLKKRRTNKKTKAKKHSTKENILEYSKKVNKQLKKRNIKQQNNSNIESDIGNEKNKTDDEGSIEKRYQKKTPYEHILIRPDTYIGSIEKITERMWVYDEGIGMNFREVMYVPGLYKIFDEILVNAADHKQRDPKMTMIKVDIDQENNLVSIWNNGKGIPVVIHKKEKIYIPELIFGHLLTGENFNDSKKKTTGGRNGYGAKLCNIFSDEFIVETNDTKENKRFYQKYTKNMSQKDKPIIKKGLKNGFTQITFKPDLSKFGMSKLSKDMVALYTKRVYDIAGTTEGIKMKLNGKDLKINSFRQYCKMYINDNFMGGAKVTTVYEKPHERWEILVAPSDGAFQQISFVNSICTSKGGSHVKCVVEQITRNLHGVVNNKNKGGKEIKGYQIKNYLIIFVNCLIDNPTFDSQTKETLSTPRSKFGSRFKFSPNFLKKVEKSGVIQSVLMWAKFQESKQLARKNGGRKKRLSCMVKLDDANLAGSRYGKDCTLILTEGDSAKTLAISGLGVVGRDKYGVFPLRGKLLNAREATHNQIMNNKEIEGIIKILGLKQKVEYNEQNIKTLRYGHLMIMADQDLDGSHIKGLVINFIHHFWPSLLKVEGFLQEFITPIVKVTKGKRSICFFTLPEYLKWKEENNDGKGWKIKYYKGLGTSSATEAKEYFSNLDRHVIDFKYENEKDDQSINLAFSKKKIKERKEWLKEVNSDLFVDHSEKQLTYQNFINKELILFSNADNIRSIGSMIDGLKPGQRKILYCCLKKKLNKEIKVAQLVGYVSEHSAYHHGEQSLASTIIGMAHNFVGSNNVNLIQGNGQFGTRLKGGKDAAASRYIHCLLSPVTRTIYHPDDDHLLKYLKDDGQYIEPQFYIPIIPMILVNGCEGIGTGYSTKIPNYNPRDIVQNLKRKMDGQEFLPMEPWYKGFIGDIHELNEQNYLDHLGEDKRNVKRKPKFQNPKVGKKYLCRGKWEKINETTLRITELPMNSKYSWTDSYKKFLTTILTSNTNAKEKIIEDFTEYHTDTTVDFKIILKKEMMKECETRGIGEVFKIHSQINTTNMHAFDQNSKIIHYSDPIQILNNFYHVRLDYYIKRKKFLLDGLTQEYNKLSNKARFIKMIIDGDLVIQQKKRKALLNELKDLEFAAFPTQKKKNIIENIEEEEMQYDDDNKENNSSDYDYLLKMPLWNLTWERYQKILQDRESKKQAKDELAATEPLDIWRSNLDDFLTALGKVEKKELEEMENIGNNNNNNNNKNKNNSSTKKTSKGGRRGRGKATLGCKSKKKVIKTKKRGRKTKKKEKNEIEIKTKPKRRTKQKINIEPKFEKELYINNEKMLENIKHDKSRKRKSAEFDFCFSKSHLNELGSESSSENSSKSQDEDVIKMKKKGIFNEFEMQLSNFLISEKKKRKWKKEEKEKSKKTKKIILNSQKESKFKLKRKSLSGYKKKLEKKKMEIEKNPSYIQIKTQRNFRSKKKVIKSSPSFSSSSNSEPEKQQKLLKTQEKKFRKKPKLNQVKILKHENNSESNVNFRLNIEMSEESEDGSERSEESDNSENSDESEESSQDNDDDDDENSNSDYSNEDVESSEDESDEEYVIPSEDDYYD
ncbi:DNA topoisomerase/gyrase [Anaeramoeba flamelloides]|uniref:DNA topoisomerase (ATP-hydrolyzing) n=1 Tax=Anaeramoeba flamelloides TaxID=1746091 RepID=A0AAV8A3F1_9EUKA|nr:DNA topoisomerase/gyrase [Anaeramoeba flamelloides]